MAKVKNNQMANEAMIIKNETNIAPPILVTSVSSPLTSVLQCNNTSSTPNNGTIVKKPGIILLTQASLSKLLSTSDLNVINNNSNTNTANHTTHFHQHDNNIRNKCNLVISTTNPNTTQHQQHKTNNQLTSVLMINSTMSTIDTTTGVVTLTSTTGPIQSGPNRAASNDIGQNINQVEYKVLFLNFYTFIKFFFLKKCTFLGIGFIESKFTSNSKINNRTTITRRSLFFRNKIR